jgi:citrate synthase
MDRMLQSEEAARRLGVKVSTLYAYVSRGLLASHPEPDGRRSLFALADIEHLARRRRTGSRVESGLATVTTGVTQLREGGPYYRGRPATELASRMTFEEVAALLWGNESGGDWTPPDLGECPLVRVSDRMRWTLVMCGAYDPLRSDLSPVAVTRAARRVIAALTDVVPGPKGGGGPQLSIAMRLAQRLGGAAVESSTSHDASGWAAAVNAALVLMADHELAASTLAVRVAACTRADLYDALLAGLATLAGPLHGAASQGAYELLVKVERDGASRALNDIMHRHETLPGFGHKVYKNGDPRFAALWDLARPLLTEERHGLFLEILERAAADGVPKPNCDLALAALSWGTGMPPDAGRTIFTVARIAGWTAHYQEELMERPLRFRTRAVYSV